MKRIFVFAAIASIALASCQKNEVITASNDSQKEISVLAFNDVRTKGYTGWASGKTAFEEVANPSATTLTPSPRDLILSAYDKTMGLDYFTGKTFAKAADDQWKCATPVYYPIGGDELEFLAYSVGKVGTPCSINPIWNDARNLTIQVSSATDDDILYGAATSKAATQPATGVAMEFQHAQAWLTVKLTSNIEKPTEGTAGDILKVKSITWENIYSSGELNIAYVEATPTTPTATWNFFTQSPSDFEMTDDNDVKASYVYKVAEGSAVPSTQILDMLVPEQPAQNFIITYELGGKEFTYEVTKDKFANAKFEAGSHYTFNVDFTVKEITIAPTVKVFTDVTGFETDPLKI